MTVTIDGGSGVTIQRDMGATDFRIFYVSNGADVTFNSLTIIQGRMMAYPNGGGIYNNHGTIMICPTTMISGNTGGGIFNDRNAYR